VTAVVVVGCGNSADGPGFLRRHAQRVRAVGYWARETLDGGEPYGDYQSMGLSNRQYGILREAGDAARVRERDQGAPATDELIGRQVRRAGAEGYRDGAPGVGPWQR
jgi:hypothetical protein